MDFPTLSLKPALPLDFEREDAVLRSESDGGYEMTRPRFTRNRMVFTLQYEDLPMAECLSLDSFYVDDCANGSVIFNWVHPGTGVSHKVRFKQPPKFSQTSYGYCNVQIILRQA